MAKGILIKAPDLFTVDEQLDIQKQFKSDDIEIAFLKGDQIQASFNSFIEMYGLCLNKVLKTVLK